VSKVNSQAVSNQAQKGHDKTAMKCLHIFAKKESSPYSVVADCAWVTLSGSNLSMEETKPG
jgi:hypothetical protein